MGRAIEIPGTVMMEFLNMDGYGIYVWPAYLIVAIVLIVNLMTPLRRHRKLLGEISTRKNRNGTDAP